jgi:hypothetical protein
MGGTTITPPPRVHALKKRSGIQPSISAQTEISLSARTFQTSSFLRRAVRPLPPGGQRQSNSSPALTAYFCVKTKCSSIFALTSLMWVKYWRKPPL